MARLDLRPEQRLDRRDRVRVFRSLVVAHAHDPRKAQREPALVACRRLQPVERDLEDDLRIAREWEPKSLTADGLFR